MGSSSSSAASGDGVAAGSSGGGAISQYPARAGVADGAGAGHVTAQCPFCRTILRAVANAVNVCPTCHQQFSLQRPGSGPSLPGVGTASMVRTVEPDRIMMHRNHPTATVQCTCPFCSTALTATARGLRASGGLMVCGRCHQQFNVQVSPGGSQQHFTRAELLQLISLLAAGNPGSRVPSASQAQINQLPTRTVVVKPLPDEAASGRDDDERITCMICLAEKEVGETVRTLPCMHDFHVDCIDQWLKTNCTCPICKTDILTGISDAAESNDGGRGGEGS